jgi:hypothetical protein
MTSHLHIICTLSTDLKNNCTEVIEHVSTTLIQIERLYLRFNDKLITNCERRGHGIEPYIKLRLPSVPSKEHRKNIVFR